MAQSGVAAPTRFGRHASVWPPGKEEHAYDVQPPAATLYGYEGGHREAGKGAGEVAGDPEGGRVGVVLGVLCLQGQVGSVHREEQGHEDDLCDEDVVRIAAWPTI